jgi:hypothetical protein
MSAPTEIDSTSQAILDALRRAVAQTMERKRNLRQYIVQWSGETPVYIGPDAPTNHSKRVAEEPPQTL